MTDVLNMFGSSNDPYPSKKVGSFGSFGTAESFPVEYLLTTFSVSDLEELTFAKEIKPNALDFGLLMQREIDEERVKEEIKPYLKSGKDKTVFFPPLLVSILPVIGKNIQPFYNNQKVTLQGNLSREYERLFKINHPTTNEHNAYPLSIKLNGSEEKYSIMREPCQIEMNYAKGNELGCKLVVIDGQHRLKALKDLYKDSPELIPSLVVPVCLLFTPNSTYELQQCEGDIASVTEVFRQLFVDVNNNAVQVGGHFNILLGEGEIGKLICRDFCTQILAHKGLEALAMIEWNQKTRKLSTEITRNYSITSVGVLNLALEEYISSEPIYSYLLDMASDDGVLFPQSSGEDGDSVNSSAEWNKFTLVQKRRLESLISTEVTPLLIRIFTEVEAYKANMTIFEEELHKLKAEAQKEGGNIDIQPAIDQLLEYIPIPKSSKYNRARVELSSFERNVYERRKEEYPDIAFRNVFQRGVIYAWAELLKISKKHQLGCEFATNALIILVNASISRKGELFSMQNKFIQNYIFNQTRISPNKDSVAGIGALIISNLLRSEVINDVKALLPSSLDKVKVDNFVQNTHNFSYKKLNTYMKTFEKKYKKFIEKSYPLLSSPFTNDEREQLREAHELKLLHQKEVREKIRAKADVSTEFDNLIAQYSNVEVVAAEQELMKFYELEVDLFGLINGDDD